MHCPPTFRERFIIYHFIHFSSLSHSSQVPINYLGRHHQSTVSSADSYRKVSLLLQSGCIFPVIGEQGLMYTILCVQCSNPGMHILLSNYPGTCALRSPSCKLMMGLFSKHTTCLSRGLMTRDVTCAK